MAKISILSATATDKGVAISLRGKAKPEKLNSTYFTLTGADGSEIRAARAEYTTTSNVRLTFDGYEDLTGEYTVAYNPPQKDKSKGVIQSKSGKDAKSWQQTIAIISNASGSESEATQDSLTNAWTYNGHTYQLITNATSWENARRDAITRGGYLAEANDAAENAALYTELQTRAGSSAPRAGDGGDSRYIWLGGTDADAEGQWIWSNSRDAISSGRSEWGRGSLGSEPDNSFSGQHALAIGLENWPLGSSSGSGYGNAGQWNDINGSNSLYYVVEYNQVLPIV